MLKLSKLIFSTNIILNDRNNVYDNMIMVYKINHCTKSHYVKVLLQLHTLTHKIIMCVGMTGTKVTNLLSQVQNKELK